MSSLKNRVAKLESAMLIDSEPLRIARFIFMPGVEPDGYTCNGVEIVQELGESSESLRKRCHEAVSWPDEPCSRLVFYPQVDREAQRRMALAKENPELLEANKPHGVYLSLRAH